MINDLFRGRVSELEVSDTVAREAEGHLRRTVDEMDRRECEMRTRIEALEREVQTLRAASGMGLGSGAGAGMAMTLGGAEAGSVDEARQMSLCSTARATEPEPEQQAEARSPPPSRRLETESGLKPWQGPNSPNANGRAEGIENEMNMLNNDDGDEKENDYHNIGEMSSRKRSSQDETEKASSDVLGYLVRPQSFLPSGDPHITKKMRLTDVVDTASPPPAATMTSTTTAQNV